MSWCQQLYKWTIIAAKLNPAGYCYRMGWIYADGIGCKVNAEKAFEYFRESYEQGDWRGADAIAKLYEEQLDNHPDFPQKQ